MNLVKRIYNNLQYRKKIFLSSPEYIIEKRKYGFIHALRPYFFLPAWFTTKSGAKVYLGKDKIDEFILKDLCIDEIGRYFTTNLQLKTKDIVLDVGAHHGLYAMELNARYSGIKILCIEPDPEGIAIIRKHIKKNKANALVLPCAIGLEEKIAFLADNEDGSWGKTIEIKNINNSALTVNVKTLKNILANIELNNIKLIKSNCEGGEFDLIPQVIELGIKPDLIILMIHPDRGDIALLIQSLKDYGYEANPVWESEINPCWHFIKQKKTTN